MNSEDNIRPPDEAITERLVDNNINIQFNDKDTYNDELNLVLELSKNEYNFSQEFEEQKEIDTIIQQSKTELEKYTPIKNKLNKILLFDKPNSGIYEYILSIIHLYETGYITYYYSNKTEYKNIFDILKSIRLTNDEFNSLKNLIIEE